jgi:hypothetical protein
MKRGTQNQFFSTPSALIKRESLTKPPPISGSNWPLMFVSFVICFGLISRADQLVFTNLPPNGGGAVRTLVASGNQLYVGFALPPPVFVPADPVLAQWDGKAWSALGGGLRPFSQNLFVFTIVPAGTNLFVGGEFITPDGLATNLRFGMALSGRR